MKPAAVRARPARHPVTHYGAGVRVAWLALAGILLSPALRRLAGRYAARPRPVTVAAVAGAVSALLACAAGAPDGTPWRLAAALWVATFGVCLAFVDAAAHRLPDALTLPAFAGAVVLLALDGSLVPALLGASALAGGYLLLVLLHPAGMGLGDAKLALCLGALLGPHGAGPVALGATAGLALAGGYAAILLILRRATPATHLPHGPFMLLGALTALILTGL